MNTSLLDDGVFRGTLKQLWTKWKTLTRHFPNKSVWWDRYTKKRIKTTFLRENAAQKKTGRLWKNSIMMPSTMHYKQTLTMKTVQ
jgi:hypothetical protein